MEERIAARPSRALAQIFVATLFAAICPFAIVWLLSSVRLLRSATPPRGRPRGARKRRRRPVTSTPSGNSDTEPAQADGDEPRSYEGSPRVVFEARSPTYLLRCLPQVVLATAVVALFPIAAVWAISALGLIRSVLPLIAIGMALSLTTSFFGGAFWSSRSGSGDLL